MAKEYDYLLKVLLVGDSDVGKQEILSGLDDPQTETFCSGGSGSKFSNIVNIIYINIKIQYNFMLK